MCYKLNRTDPLYFLRFASSKEMTRFAHFKNIPYVNLALKLGVVTFARWPPERPYCFVRMESAEAAQQVLNYAKQFNTDKNDPTFVSICFCF